MPNNIESLRPKRRQKLIDLVRDAGVDVSDWARFKGGPHRASSNPKYCYEWAFCAPDSVVVVSVWHEQLREVEGHIILEDNLRETAEFYSNAPGKGMWKKRADAFDQFINLAAEQALPIRAIICDGRKRAKFDLEAQASEVLARSLDPAPWAVTRYDRDSGSFVLNRGALPHRLKDQFSLDPLPPTPTETRNISGSVFVRDRAIRDHALTRANGRCEWCHVLGFATDDGSVFLETHHVVPLSENGLDTRLNVVALCANHHREAHFGSSRVTMRDDLLKFLETGKAIRRNA